MKYERKTVTIFLAAMLFFSIILILSGCSSSKSSTATPSPAPVTSPTASPSPTATPSSSNVLVTSDDSSISLSVPSGWNTHDTSLWPGAAIGVSNDANSQYVVVVKHPNSTLPTNYTLNEFLTDEKAAFASIATNLVWGQTSNISIGGLKGITVELKGTGKKSHSDFVYWISLLQGANNFYNVCGWTLNNMAGTNKPIIQNVMNSFKESKGPLQGTLTGTYSGQGPNGPENGTLSLTIYGNGTIEGSFAGSHTGTLTGQVDTTGNLNATGTAGTGANATQITWTGKVTESGNSLSIQGTWSGSNRSGTFSATGAASQ